MARIFVILLFLILNLSPLPVKSQNKSFSFSSMGGINTFFGLKGEYDHPLTEYKIGEAFTAEVNFISGRNYLPNQFACGIVLDYFSGSFREYSEGFNGYDYLNGKASKVMLGAYLVPYIFDYDRELFIKPGIEWSYLLSANVDGFIRSIEVPTYGQEIELDNEFATKSDLGVSLSLEYVIELKKRWYIAPKYKLYCSLQGTLTEMNTFRNTIGVAVGYRLRERLNDFNRLP